MELTTTELRRTVAPERLGFETTQTVPPTRDSIEQARARDAINFAMGMAFPGYNLYALGSPQTDMQTVVTSRLRTLAEDRRPPSDWAYLRNFDEPAQPLYLELPAADGRRFRQRMQEAIGSIRDLLPGAFSSEEFRRQSQELASSFRETQSQDMSALEAQAREMGLTLLPTPNGFVFAPVKEGKVMEQEAFMALDENERNRIQEAIRTMTQRLVERLQHYPEHEHQLIERQRELQRATAEGVIRHTLVRLRTLYQDRDRAMNWLAAVEKDLLANIDRILAAAQPAQSPMPMMGDPESWFDRYKVNVIVDHTDLTGAPVLYESNPSLDNLIGSLEQRFEFGMPVTDTNLIRAGALHRANGGYLVLDAERVLTKPFAWEALKRALTDRAIRVESVGKLLSLTYSVSLEPEAIPLDVKVVLLGSRYLYHVLRAYDNDFDTLFKVVADFDDHVDWSEDALHAYAGLIAHIVTDRSLRHLTANAVARVIEHASRLVEDQEQISTHVTDIRDLLQEADYMAQAAHARLVDRVHVQQAIEQRIYRLDRFRELVRENIAKGIIRVETRGAAVGQINGLSVVSIGHVQFGQPSRITATARLGRGELIDIERESHLGGNIHSKAVMIVSSYIGSRYARDYPLSLHATLVFEQSYGGVEGDSASVAEVCALLSAMIDRPVRQSLAITGSMDQHGLAQAIGGVNEKIEGFFDVCQTQGLSGDQGVIIPAANRQHLMLREDVVAAVEAGQFHLYTMTSVDDAIALLFAAEGEKSTDPTAIHDAVSERVIELHSLAKKHAGRDGTGNEIADKTTPPGAQ
ncbi:MAG: AAA family ATPase [Pseudomonadales bacterium]